MARMLSSRKGYHPMLCGDEGPVPQQDRAVRLRDQCCMHGPPPIPDVGCLGADGSESRKLQYYNFSIIRRTANGELDVLVLREWPLISQGRLGVRRIKVNSPLSTL
jgi:hypothetical protein